MVVVEINVLTYEYASLIISFQFHPIDTFCFKDRKEVFCQSVMKLSITLDTLTARILKLSSDSQSRIEPAPFYSWWDPANGRADSAVAPVAHKISPDHRF